MPTTTAMNWMILTMREVQLPS